MIPSTYSLCTEIFLHAAGQCGWIYVPKEEVPPDLLFTLALDDAPMACTLRTWPAAQYGWPGDELAADVYRTPGRVDLGFAVIALQDAGPHHVAAYMSGVCDNQRQADEAAGWLADCMRDGVLPPVVKVPG